MGVLVFCLTVCLECSIVCECHVCGPSACRGVPSRSWFYALICHC